jgi:hypothetical protein
MTNSNEPATASRVVRQYNSDGERVYEVATADASLELRVSSRSVGGGQRRWHIAAQQANSPDSTSISEEAESKGGALSKVAAQWVERATELGLPTFDWAAVETALRAVRGI